MLQPLITATLRSTSRMLWRKGTSLLISCSWRLMVLVETISLSRISSHKLAEPDSPGFAGAVPASMGTFPRCGALAIVLAISIWPGRSSYPSSFEMAHPASVRLSAPSVMPSAPVFLSPLCIQPGSVIVLVLVTLLFPGASTSSLWFPPPPAVESMQDQ